MASLSTRLSYWWPIKRLEDNGDSISVEAESSSGANDTQSPVTSRPRQSVLRGGGRERVLRSSLRARWEGSFAEDPPLVSRATEG